MEQYRYNNKYTAHLSKRLNIITMIVKIVEKITDPNSPGLL